MGESDFPLLLSEGSIGGMVVRNRMVMPAMGVNMAEGGFVNDAIINHYVERAKGGVGLIIVEVTCVDAPLGLNTSRMLVIDDEEYIPGFRRLTDAIHAQGARCVLEISHTGRGAKRKNIGGQPVGPSAVKKPYDFIVGFEGEEPRALTLEEIGRIEDRYADAALRAQKAGFDGVEVHATGYYLVAQFLSSTANLRKDEYGGNAVNRARFAIEIARKIRERTGPDFPLLYKLSVLEIGEFGGISLRDGLLTCWLLQQAGVDAIEVLAGAWSTHPGKRDTPDSGQSAGFTFPIVRLMKLARITRWGKRPGFVFGRRALTLPLISGGRTFDPVLAEKALSRGWGELIFMGRALLAQPDFPRMIADGTYEDARPCIGCGKCTDGQLQRDERIACSGNAVLGVGENDYRLPPTGARKKVLVVGGGPAGVEAARIAALRGHDVTLYEKERRLGGQLHDAIVPPHKGNLAPLLRYLERQALRTGVKVVLGREMSAEDVLAEKPDAVVCATGVSPARLPIPGFDEPSVMNVKTALKGARVGRRVVIIGGGVVGCEAAELFAGQGKTVSVVEMLDSLAGRMVATSRVILLGHIERMKVNVYTSHRCVEIRGRSVVIETADGARKELAADTVLIAVGDRPNRTLASQLAGRVTELSEVGDEREPASILEAVATGYAAGIAL
jgi:2,4-dienoyl-CoA reductase-like NADH-dependent reductase (Old Yellow Enzyme family)/thioredoxin reductase